MWCRVLDRTPSHCVQAQHLREAQERRRQGKKAPKRINITKLKDSLTKKVFVDTLEEWLDAIPLDKQDIEAAWTSLHETVYNTAMECLSTPARKHKDWFDENHSNISPMLEQKRAAHLALIQDTTSTAKKDALRSIRSTVQLKLCEMQDSWLSAKFDDIQGFADGNDMNNFYSSLKEVYGPTSAGYSVRAAPRLSQKRTRSCKDELNILTPY